MASGCIRSCFWNASYIALMDSSLFAECTGIPGRRSAYSAHVSTDCDPGSATDARVASENPGEPTISELLPALLQEIDLQVERHLHGLAEDRVRSHTEAHDVTAGRSPAGSSPTCDGAAI
jgi:hypothetical protein